MIERPVIKQIYFIFSILTLFLTLSLRAQDIIEDLEDSTPLQQESDTSSFPTEVILKIAQSKKIMLLSNSNNSFREGDFLSLITKNNLMVRVLCAKIRGQNCGIKLISIYDDQLWVKAFEGLKVQVLRGDDAQFKQETKVTKKNEVEALEDLYKDDELFEDDSLELRDNKKRLLKNDNVVGISYGLLKGVDEKNKPHHYGHWHIQWAYQIVDNFWGEAVVGQAVIGQFPSPTLDTQITSMTLRFKYTIKAPFYSFILPYIGYQTVIPSSPEVGKVYPGSTASGLEEEKKLFDNMKKSTIIFGVTVLKRIVPGWFLRTDIGSDFFSAGLSLEF